jgi:hypothetical protein
MHIGLSQDIDIASAFSPGPDGYLRPTGLLFTQRPITTTGPEKLEIVLGKVASP